MTIGKSLIWQQGQVNRINYPSSLDFVWNLALLIDIGLDFMHSVHNHEIFSRNSIRRLARLLKLHCDHFEFTELFRC